MKRKDLCSEREAEDVEVKSKCVKLSPTYRFEVNCNSSDYSEITLYLHSEPIATLLFKIRGTCQLFIKSLDITKPEYKGQKIGTFFLLYVINAVLEKYKDTENKITNVVLEDYSANYGKPDNIYTKVGFVGVNREKKLNIENSVLPVSAQEIFDALNVRFFIKKIYGKI